jgi:hypothetical protein
MVIKNDRVIKILDFIETFKVCDITHIARLFYGKNKFPILNAQDKMTAMFKDKLVNRKRNNVNNKYTYYLGKEPVQIQHRLILTEIYTVLKCRFISVKCQPEYICGNVRADGYIEIRNGGKTCLMFIEVQISNTPVDIKKYELLYSAGRFPNGIFPVVLVVTDQIQVLKSELFDIIKIRVNLEGLYERIYKYMFG